MTEKLLNMKLSRIYPMLVQKAERKGKTKKEVDEIILWLLGYSDKELNEKLEEDVTYEAFFTDAPKKNPNRKLIKGVICGIRVEEMTDPLLQDIRYLDKLVDELAKGKAMEKILREEKKNR